MTAKNPPAPRLRGLVTDVDGTITDPHRRIHTGAIEAIRALVDHGVEVVRASGNTACFMDALCRMLGTRGIFIAENGAVYRTGYSVSPVAIADGASPRDALDAVVRHFRERGLEIEHYSLPYRFVDVAFARTVPVDEVREVVRRFPVEVLDTGFAIHLQPLGVTKGLGFSALARDTGMDTREFLAVGDAENDVELLERAGVGAAVGNAGPEVARAAEWVSEKKYGDGFVEAITRYFPYFLER
jgi:hypothetical protein